MVEKRILDNIFRETGPITRFAVVQERVSATSFKVKDNAGKIFVAACSGGEFYAPGMRVIVQNERIIGTGQLAGNHREYEV